MKNLISLSLILLLLSCSEERRFQQDELSPITEKTNATFVLNILESGVVDNDPQPPASKAFADFNTDPKVENGALERKINPADVRLLIFDAITGILEVNETYGTISGADDILTKTVQVTSGSKKIFVIANAGAITSGIAALQKDVSTLVQFNALVYDAGAPQFPWSNKTTVTRSYNIKPLYAFSGSAGLPASNTDQYTYILKAGIEADPSLNNNSGSGGLATVNNNTVYQDFNHFQIDLIYMVAKARLGFTGTAISHSTIASISDFKYSIHNLARYTNYVQHVVGSNPCSYYYGKSFNSPFVTAGPFGVYDYGYHFDASENASQSAALITTTAPYTFPANTPYLYVPENNNTSALTWNQASFYSINAHYKPHQIVVAVGYQSGVPTPLQLTTTSTHPSPPVGYIYLRHDIAGPHGTLLAGTCFGTLALLQKAAWLCMQASSASGGGWTGSTTQVDYADVIIGSPPPTTVPPTLPVYPPPSYGYYVFSVPNASNNTGGNWYRVAIGDPSNADPYYKFGVFRGKAYNGVISAVGGPGVPYEWMMLNDVSDPINAPSHATARIQIKNWEMVMLDISLY